MSKKLVICTDGTWNPVENISRRIRTSTNVAKIAALTAPESTDGMRQIVCYVQGVGTHQNDAISGGAFGWGLSANVEHAYRFLVQNYEPGDELYLFGFSRGAYTARSLAGLLRNCGIVTTRSPGMVDDALNLYKDRRDETDPESIRARVFRNENSHEVEVRFLGVWDTVGALGVPFIRHQIAKTLGWDWQFHDASLGPHIRHACHALAIHETRSKFLPTLWIAPEDSQPSQVLEQVWFSGCHSNVGGGYVDTDLSDIALEWMIQRATVEGLSFDDNWKNKLRVSGQGFKPKPTGNINSEFKGIYPYIDAVSGCPNGVCRQMEQDSQSSAALSPRPGDPPWLPKMISHIMAPLRHVATTPAAALKPITFETIHESVHERYAANVPGDWWPPNIEDRLIERSQSGKPTQ